MTARRVLLTGASGCIGRAIAPRLLDRGWDVHAVARQAPRDMDPRIRWHARSLLEAGAPEAVIEAAQPDALVHLAWYIAPGRWAAAPENVAWVQASLALMRAFASGGGRRFVGAGSCLEYDWAYGYCSEARTPRHPQTLYGTSKHALQLLVEGLATQSALSWAWGRVFFLHGPYEHPDRLVPAVMRALLRGEPARVSHGRQVRDYLHVDDVAEAFLALLEGEAQGAFNICSGQAVTLRTIVEAVGRLAGAQARIEFGAIPAAATDTPLVVGDPSRMAEIVGWTPRVPLAEGLERTWRWWQQAEAIKVNRA